MNTEDLVADMTKRIVEGRMDAKEKILESAIDKRIGTNWKVEDLKGRLERIVFPSGNKHSTIEYFMLDGKDLLRVEEDLDIKNHIINIRLKYWESEDVVDSQLLHP